MADIPVSLFRLDSTLNDDTNDENDGDEKSLYLEPYGQMDPAVRDTILKLAKAQSALWSAVSILLVSDTKVQ